MLLLFSHRSFPLKQQYHILKPLIMACSLCKTDKVAVANVTAKIHLVGWDKVCSSIRWGGLGVRNVRVFNKALLGKWLWRYHSEGEGLCREVIESMYGSLRGGWCSNEVRGAHGVGLWKNIRAGWDKFSQFFRVTIGSSNNVLFWHDV
ncbi:hypothetical protein I3843_02G054700 [Carya illinoinensis]|nr:hypothetical protein I3843_02G054700 [Carya illinoinensis]